MKQQLHLLLLFIFLSWSYAQGQTCSYIAPTGSAPQPTSCNGTPTASITGFNGMSVDFQVTAGNVYTFSTCGGASWDTQLALWNLGGTIQYAYNDDDCGLQSTITWTATFTGTVVLMLYEYSCNTDGTFTGATIDISCDLPGPPPPSPPVCSAPTSTQAGPLLSCNGSASTVSGLSNGDGVVISVVAGETYTITTCGLAGWDTQLELWDLGLTGSYAYNDDDCGLQSTITWTATFTGDVVIALYEFSCNTDGTFTGASIEISCGSVGGPPSCTSNPPPADACTGAPLISNFEGYCGSTSGYTVQTPGNLSTAFCGSIENNAFLSFIAANSTINIDYWITGGASCPSGAQFQILQAPAVCNAAGGTWTAFTPCVNPSGTIGSNGTMTVTGLTVGQLYYLMIDGYAGDVCNYVFGAASGLLLPVEYYHLDAHTDGSANVISWATAEEMDAQHFEVQRSVDGIDFETIGTVAANGQNADEYNYRDEFPTRGVNYYRLKQVDYDSDANFSDMVALTNLDKLSADDFTIAPNPTTDVANITFVNPEKDELAVQVYDVTGRLVLEQQVQVQEGMQQLPLDMTRFANGVYLIRMQLKNSGLGISKRLIKH